ncbi:cystathionine gamma-synthase [Astrocystis sublimbata]|nr:cystathionine gamma-synthase [Astrocystis sublimbata]
MALSFVDPSTVAVGQSLPPRGPHAITTHIPGWRTAERFHDREASLLNQLTAMYPRFLPFGITGTLCDSLSQWLSLPDEYDCAAFTSQDAWASNRKHAISELRNTKRLDPSELRYHVVEIAGVRLFVVGFPRAKTQAAIFQWYHGGLGFSTRLSEALLRHYESIVDLGEFPDGVGAPEPTFLPEGPSHQALRERIVSLMMRACVREYKKSVSVDDVFLYQTGMAGIMRLHEALETLRDGPTVVFGAIFKSTFQIFSESEGGIKHYGRADDSDVDDFEKYLGEGGKCAYVFTEFPSNPLMVSVDITRLRKLADKYGFYLVADDTLASFANIDLLGVADVVVSSLTKTFSGYADVMAGSVVLNPNSANVYPDLKQVITSRFHNELFEADAAHLLSNNENFLVRSAIHNRNASAIASHFHSLALDPSSPVTQVNYPPYSQGSNHLQQFMRKPTPEFPEPGYGCLLSFVFETVEQAVQFYDALNLFQGPHLGAHLTLTMPYSAIVYGRDHPEYHAAYGLKPSLIRLSAGLEDQSALLEQLVQALKEIKS